MHLIPTDPRLRYIAAGGFAAGVNWLVRFPLSLFMPFGFAVALATVIGMVIGFFTYKHFVFDRTDRAIWLQVRDFIGVNIVGAAATVIVAVAIRDIPQWPADWMIIIDPTAHATGIALAAFVNYFGHRYITFSRAPPASVLDSKAPESADPSGLLNDHT
ncbi:MAG: GtrA family protein [Hyphomonas sp.]